MVAPPSSPLPETAWTMNSPRKEVDAAARRGRLAARPVPGPHRRPHGHPGRPGEAAPAVETLNDAGGPTALVSVPSGYRPDRPAPLLVLLHGSGGTARQAIGWLEGAVEASIILVAPQAEGRSWDFVLGGYGPDVARIDRVLAVVFDRFSVDPGHLAIGGFSDGASYALSLGLVNGDLFSRVVAFSPGFAAPTRTCGRPRFFVSHGTGDSVLPIGACSRRLVPRLRDAGYDVTYREFDGGHDMPPAVLRDALAWLLDTP